MRYGRIATIAGLLTGLLVTGCGSDVTHDVKPEIGIAGELPVEFGLVEVGGTAQRQLVLSNSGGATLTVESVDVLGANRDWFSVSPKNPGSIGSASDQELTVAFHPLDVADAQAEIVLKTNAKNGTVANGSIPIQNGEVRILLTGRGFLPTVQVDPTVLDFRKVVTGTSRTLSINVSNTGEDRAAVRLSSVTGQGAAYYTVRPPSGTTDNVFVLEAEAEAHIEVAFAPTEAGTWPAILGIQPCDVCQRVNVMLNGEGIDSGLIVEPLAIEFGKVNPGSVVTKPIVFRNVGNRLVQITEVRTAALVGGVADPAFGVSLPEMPIDLAEGAEVEVGITFSPTSAGSTHIAQAVWKSTDTKNTSGQVTLSGSGGGPDVEVLPPNVAFGPVAVGTFIDKKVVITNVGWEDLRLDEVLVEGSDAFSIVTMPEAGLVKVGDIKQAVVRCSPTAEQEEQGRLVVRSNDADEPEAYVNLSCTGLVLPPCNYVVRPPELHLGLVELNKPTYAETALVNTNVEGDCLISNVVLSDETDAPFFLPPEKDYSQPTLVAPGEQYTIQVGIQPDTVGEYNGALSFYVSSPEAPHVLVPLNAVAQKRDLQIIPDDYDFGVTMVDCNTAKREFCVYNTKSSAIVMRSVKLEQAGHEQCTPSSSCEFLLSNLPDGILTGTGETIASGQKECFQASYRPSDLGTDEGHIYVQIDGYPAPHPIRITGTGAEEAVQTDHFVQVEKPQADVLFVIDTSGSMSDDQQRLAANFDSFIKFFVQQNIDYHLGVSTTDVSTAKGNVPGLLHPQNAAEKHLRVVHPDMPDPAAQFKANVMVGDDGSNTECGFDGAYRTLTDPLINDPDMNGGFLRYDANLAIVFVSDEPEQSTTTTSDGCSGRPYDFFLSFFQNIKGFRNQHLFSANSIVASNGTLYIQMSKETNGLYEDLNTPNWAAMLENLARVGAGFKVKFILKNQAKPDTVSVKVTFNGRTFDVTAFEYIADENAIVFDPAAVPEAGAKIDVTYETQCL